MEAYVRLGNESVKADATELKRLVLRGKNSSYDALGTKYSVSDYVFSKLRERYKAWTGESLEDKELVSSGLVDDKGKLTNGGALLADDSPIRWYAQGFEEYVMRTEEVFLNALCNNPYIS